MWMNENPIAFTQLNQFEKRFRFTFHPALQKFIQAHNGGNVTPGTFPTNVRERKLLRLLDFSDPESRKGAWQINAKHRSLIGPQRIIIGIDSLGNYVCVQREYKHQTIVVWNHVTDSFEDCLWELPAFIQYVG